MDDGRALQDVFKVQCFGCGALNERGLQIKSHWDGDELVCRHQLQPHFIGHPGVVYGGAIASIVDCHSIWTAMATYVRDHQGGSLESPPAYVTGKLAVNYLKPAAIDQPLLLRSRVVDAGERRSTVACRVLQGELEVANAEVIAVRIKLP